MKLFDLSGKTAVVTGASGAIGSCLARGLAEAGASLALCYGRNRDKAEELAHTLRSLAPRVEAYQVDSRDQGAIAAHADAVAADFGKLDILVNCAGGNVAEAITGPGRTFFDLDSAALEEVVSLNLFGGCIWPCMHYGRKMIANPAGGSIINIISMNSFRPLEGRPGYAAAKAGAWNFTLWLAAHVAMECNPAVRVNAIAPGFVPNNRTLSSLVNADGTYAARGQKIIDHTPMRRLGTPEDLVGACVWYASDASAYVTGTAMPVDGGFSAYAGL